MPKAIDRLEDLIFDPENANEGTLRGEQLLEKSLGQYGAGRAIVVDRNGLVIGGNKTLQLAIESGLGVRVVQTDGSKLVVVMRVDLDLETDPKARVLAYLDNRAAEVGLKWKPEQLEADLAKGIELGGLFTEMERRSLLAQLNQEEPPVALLKSTIEFETREEQQAWLACVQAITMYEGTTFPDKLDRWVEDQLTRLDAEASGVAEAEVVGSAD